MRLAHTSRMAAAIRKRNVLMVNADKPSPVSQRETTPIVPHSTPAITINERPKASLRFMFGYPSRVVPLLKHEETETGAGIYAETHAGANGVRVRAASPVPD
jgi:hypothetical protein